PLRTRPFRAPRPAPSEPGPLRPRPFGAARSTPAEPRPLGPRPRRAGGTPFVTPAIAPPAAALRRAARTLVVRQLPQLLLLTPSALARIDPPGATSAALDLAPA